MFMQAESTEILCEISKAPQRHTGGISPPNTPGLNLLKKRRDKFGANKEENTDVKIPDLNMENTCLFGFCSFFVFP